MSLVDRLFPASELEGLKTNSRGEYAWEEHPAKRRRFGSSHSIPSIAASAADSGYSSEEGHSPSHIASAADPKPASPKQHRVDNTGLRKRQRVNSEPTSASHVWTEYQQRTMSLMQSADQQRTISRASRPVGPWPARLPTNIRDADLEIISAQHQIALARRRLHSYSSPVPTSHHDQTDIGCTAGPKAAGSLNLVTRVFDGCRIMNNERSLIDSLFNKSEETLEEATPGQPTSLMVEESHKDDDQVQFAGLAIPVYLDEDEMGFEPGAYLDDPTNTSFEDFFNLDDASTREIDEAKP